MNALMLTDLSSAGEEGASLLQAAIEQLEAHGWQLTVADLTRVRVKPCLVCGHCSLKKPGVCVLQDDFAELFAQIPRHGILVLAGAVRFGTWRPPLKLGLDRFLPLLAGFYTRRHGEMHHQLRYDEPTRLLGLGLHRPGFPQEAELLEQLVDRHHRNWAMRSSASAVGGNAAAVLEALPAAIARLEAP